MYYSYKAASNGWRNKTLKLIKALVPEENQYVEYWDDYKELGNLIMRLKDGDTVFLTSILDLITPSLVDMISILRYFERHNIEIYSDDEPNVNTKGCCELISIFEEFVDFEDLD